ncbi:Calcium-dependent protein kinase 11 [Hibiscus syriacus]|uniref:non-specific serine/threonine protein kinase n=1 Tax=Hibiscus syriacus TaxID=106335 RepID=A0A6A3B234_HIBSY|nr:Calcium-dependent protein kinase 11 [Hibiscus syriacus]
MISGTVFFDASLAVKAQQLPMKVLYFSSLDLKDGFVGRLESVMAVAKSSSFNETSKQPCNCYKIESLSETILEADQTANLRDRYILGEQLGWGQFGVISLCSDKLTREVLACKSISKDRLVTSDDARCVKLEIEIMTRLSGHPNVVDLKAVYEDEDHVHLVMELCAGGELFHRLERYGRFPEADARVLFRHLMQVVLYCHEIGIVHRDLKPENILLATKASSSPIKLADFGLATYIKPGQCLYGTVGSPFYIAPEVLVGGYNQAADIWSAGVILYILLSGTPPFWGKTKSRIFDAVRAADLQFPSDPWDRISGSAKNLVRGMLNRSSSKAHCTADHSWMKNDESFQEESSAVVFQSCGELEFHSGSFSMSRDQDISFGAGSPIICDVQSPTLTSRTSFSSFFVEPSTPCLASGGFSFHSINSDTLEFHSAIPSMPSFAFFSPSSGVEQENCKSDLSINIIQMERLDGGLDKLLVLPDSSLCFGPEAREKEIKADEFGRTGGTSGSRLLLAFHSKRNRTIGHGEREQLDFMVSESVIRWASCTNLPTATSLRSSLWNTKYSQNKNHRLLFPARTKEKLFTPGCQRQAKNFLVSGTGPAQRSLIAMNFQLVSTSEHSTINKLNHRVPRIASVIAFENRHSSSTVSREC